MAFTEIRFPTDIGYGSRGGPGFSTAIIVNDAGAEERIARWNGARRRYDVAYGVRSHANVVALKDFYIHRRGPADGFRFKDFYDCTSAADGIDSALGGTAVDDEDVQIGTGDGTETQFQLIKKYADGLVTRIRNITKPVSGTVLIAIDDVLQTEGVDYTIDYTTGVVTFASAPALNEVITAGFQFDVPVRFGEEVDLVLSATITDFSNGELEVPLIEIRDEGEIQDEFFFGGGADLSPSANVYITVQTGRAIRVDPQAGGLKLILPDETSLPSGGPYFMISNVSGANAISIRDSSDVEILSLALGTDCILYIVDVAGTNDWYAFV